MLDRLPVLPLGAVNQPRFTLAPGVQVVPLDDEAVVFNALSWETHVLNPAAALVLEMAAAAPCTEAGLREVLADVLDERESQQAAAHAQRLLRELSGLRLLIELPFDPDAGC